MKKGGMLILGLVLLIGLSVFVSAILYNNVISEEKILDIPLIKFQNGIFELKRDEKKINIRKNNIKNINKILQKN